MEGKERRQRLTERRMMEARASMESLGRREREVTEESRSLVQ